MSRERPAIVLVMAILNFVFGFFGLMCGCCGVFAQFGISALGNVSMKGPKGEENPIKDMVAFLERELPGYQAIEVSHGALLLFLGLFLIVSGIGLLLMQSWGRWLAVAVAILVIPLQIGHAIYEIGFVQPATDRWAQQLLLKQGVP